MQFNTVYYTSLYKNTFLPNFQDKFQLSPFSLLPLLGLLARLRFRLLRIASSCHAIINPKRETFNVRLVSLLVALLELKTLLLCCV